MNEAEFNSKLIHKFIQLKQKIESDKMIYGDAFVHFTERGIEVVDPLKVELKIKEK